MSATPIIVLVWLHFIADFVLQSDRVAKAKSSNTDVLMLHVWIYSLPFIPFALWQLTPWAAFQFFVFNYAAHFVTDYLSSRATAKLWLAGERHWFFVVIGLDQALHLTALFLTYRWLSA